MFEYCDLKAIKYLEKSSIIFLRSNLHIQFPIYIKTMDIVRCMGISPSTVFEHRVIFFLFDIQLFY